MKWRNRVNRVLGHGLAAFGEAVTHAPLTGSPAARRGIYNDIYEGIDPDTGFEVVSQEPNLGIILADWVPAPRQGDAVTLRGGVTYRMDRVEVDGEGGATCFLTRDIVQTATPDRASGFSAVSNILQRGMASFGEAVTHTPAGGSPGARRGVFNDIFKPGQTGAGFDVTTQAPHLGIILAEWDPAPAQGDAVTLRGGVTYRIDRIERDGEGGAACFLTRDIAQAVAPDRASGFGAVESILQRAMSVFATPVQFWPVTGAPADQQGIFNDRYEGIDPNTGAIVVSQQPNLGIKLNEWPLIPIDGDVLIIYDERYTVRHIEVDGEGGATIILDKVADLSGHDAGEFEPDQFNGGFQ